MGYVRIIFLARDRLLFKIAHTIMFLPTDGELLGTDFAANPCKPCGMKKKGTAPIAPARTTVASVKKEMQKPRLTESVRNDGKPRATAMAKQPAAHPARVRVSDRRPGAP
jgi:hypothetical protein